MNPLQPIQVQDSTALGAEQQDKKSIPEIIRTSRI